MSSEAHRAEFAELTVLWCEKGVMQGYTDAAVGNIGGRGNEEKGLCMCLSRETGHVDGMAGSWPGCLSTSMLQGVVLDRPPSPRTMTSYINY